MSKLPKVGETWVGCIRNNSNCEAEIIAVKEGFVYFEHGVVLPNQPKAIYGLVYSSEVFLANFKEPPTYFWYNDWSGILKPDSTRFIKFYESKDKAEDAFNLTKDFAYDKGVNRKLRKLQLIEE